MAFELGLKNSFDHGRFVLNIDAFYDKVSNYQANYPTTVNGTVTTTTKSRAGVVATWRGRLRRYLKPPNDGLTFKQRLAKMGLATALSYGWVSNMSYSVTVAIAWYIFSKQVCIVSK